MCFCCAQNVLLLDYVIQLAKKKKKCAKNVLFAKIWSGDFWVYYVINQLENVTESCGQCLLHSCDAC